MLGGVGAAPPAGEPERKDRRFAAPEWRENPIFDTIRQTYLRMSDQLLGTVDNIEGIEPDMREKLRFATRSFVDAMSPSNFALTNPQVLKRTIETRGENLLKGLANMLKDIASGQLTQTKPGVFEVGRNLATTPGKVVKQTPLYQLIQYTPTTDEVLKTPVVIFPPWINRFYILDLSPEKSFVKWCVDNGISLFMVSWKSADESIADATLDDYVLKGQVDAIDTVRDLLGVEAVHAIGYCVAGTTLAATLGYLHREGRGGEGQVGDLLHRAGRFQRGGRPQALPRRRDDGAAAAADGGEGLSRRPLHGRDLQPAARARPHLELCGQQLFAGRGAGAVRPASLEQRHDQPARRVAPGYLEDLYKGNKLAEKGGISVAGTPVDIDAVKTPTYVQAGREDHIAPPQSVWKIMDHFAGPETVRARGVRAYRRAW